METPLVHPPTDITIEIAVEPVYNVLNSLALLNEIERMPALDGWVIRAAAQLSETQRSGNLIVFGALRGALLAEGEWPDFPAYLDDLVAQPAEQLRERAMRWLVPNIPDDAGLIDREILTEAARAREPLLDNVLLDQAYELLRDAAALHEQVVVHLRELWEQTMAGEWRRVSGTLQSQTKAMQNNRLPQWKRAQLTRQGLPTTPDQYLAPGVLSIEDQLRTLVAPELWADPALVASTTTRVVYVNSAHTGRYVTFLHTGTTQRVFFNALRSFPAIMRTTPVSANELASRLNALADETRLSILALFNDQDVISAQEIMTRLDLSQSTASRQIRPLLAFLNENRGKGANKLYSLSPAQLELTFQAVRNLIAQGEVTVAYDDARLGQPEQLRRYMNAQGKLTMLPVRQQDRMGVLALIATKFEPGRFYSEKEVNQLIQEQIAYEDYVTIRRELYNSRFIHRELDGSRYWLSETPPLA